MDNHIQISFWKLGVLLFAFSSNSLPATAKSYSIEISRNNTLSVKAQNVFANIMSKPEITWGDFTDVDIEEMVGADTLYCSFDNNTLLYPLPKEGNTYNLDHD